ncbi:MAG TPA: hypothetical protein VH417_01650 [Vicinamibacterales bacterium]|jgi:hypothetical protein
MAARWRSLRVPVRRSRLGRGAVAGLLTLAAAGCLVRAATPPEEKATPLPVGAEAVSWQPLGAWSGTGSSQSESFIGNTGAFRVRWEAKASGARPGDLRIALHSAVSGRPIVTAVDVHGAGKGESVVSDDPRVYYVQVDSSNLEWRFTVEEGVFGAIK